MKKQEIIKATIAVCDKAGYPTCDEGLACLLDDILTPLEEETNRLEKIIAKCPNENDDLGAEFTHVQILKAENDKFRAALKRANIRLTMCLGRMIECEGSHDVSRIEIPNWIDDIDQTLGEI